MSATIEIKSDSVLVDDLKFNWSKTNESSENLKVVEALFSCLKIRDPLTAFHSIHMANYSYKLALRFDKGNAPLYYAGSLTHDIGKIGMSDRVLKGSGILTLEEREYLRKHVSDGYRILTGLGMPPIMLEIAKYHHERYDGSGYLEGLNGNNIPLPGRITAISDTYSSLTSDRPYSHAMDRSRAIKIMEQDKSKFDPFILEFIIESIIRSQT
ncbi:HD domain-containing protein (plasmid) [Paenibacillus rhizovicinus]|uniref:HD domain-containing protein n=1 Tax=Paenibacillus rhizovicinus TaxID=2704463 RepID=A0A6C0PAA8_9BACL|nr:HD domain-containing phosphohydrolase [Paenibacillus rhizovicinus]QHW35429.1 HD domain-containing protein [Paenibacillus rhizovicinus]